MLRSSTARASRRGARRRSGELKLQLSTCAACAHALGVDIMSADRPLVSYIPASDAAEIIKSGRAGRDFVVIDVRGASQRARVS